MKSIISAIAIIFWGSVAFAQTDSVVVDGKLNDWTLPLKFCDTETKLCYSLVNKDSAFYFCIRAMEKITQMRLLRVGFQISIDPKGKNRQKFNLIYKPENTMPAGGRSGEKPSPEKLKTEFQQTPILVSLSGFTGIDDDTYLAKSLKKVQFAMDWDSLNILSIEYKVPFSAIYYDTTMKKISLGITLFAMEMPSEGMPGPSNRGDGPPAGMPPPDGMSRPQGVGMPPPDGNSMGDIFSEKKFWTKFNTIISK